MSDKSINNERNKPLELEPDELSTVDISDEVLEQVDKTTKEAQRQAKKTAKKIRSPEDKRKHKLKIYSLVSAIFILFMTALVANPATRWPMANFLGFRTSLVVAVVGEEGDRISNAAVSIDGGTSALTNSKGKVRFDGVKYGERIVRVQKAGYGESTVKAVGGLKKSTATTVKLKIIGIKLDITVKDWLSGKPVPNAKAIYKKNEASADESGQMSLIIPPTDKKEITITVKADGYLNKSLKTETAASERETLLVPSYKNYFISKRDGKLDIFSSNIDGGSQQKIIEATGVENEQLVQFTIHSDNKTAILIANRDGKTQNGKVVAGIYLVNLEEASLKMVDEGSDVQFIGWGDDTAVYAKTVPTLNYDDPALSRLMAYKVTNNNLQEIANANYIQASAVAQNVLFYSLADAYSESDSIDLASYNLGNEARNNYLAGKNIVQIGRPGYSSLDVLDSTGAVFEIQINQHMAQQVHRGVSSQRDVSINAGGSVAAWSERRDGQGNLVVRSLSGNTERIAKKAPGLTNPVRFIGNNTIIARVVTSEETADYVIDYRTGTMKKVVDVLNISTGMRQSGF